MNFILALDQGTTSSRALVFDHDGSIRGTAQKEFRQIFPSPGLVEHDAEEIWASQLGVAVEAVARAGATATDIAAIGITNQRETTVVWDRRSGKPIHNAIVWQDRRTAGECDLLRSQGVSRFFAPGPDWCSTPIFPEQNWPGFLTMCRAPARGQKRESWPSARSIPGSSGT